MGIFNDTFSSRGGASFKTEEKKKKKEKSIFNQVFAPKTRPVVEEKEGFFQKISSRSLERAKQDLITKISRDKSFGKDVSKKEERLSRVEEAEGLTGFAKTRVALGEGARRVGAQVSTGIAGFGSSILDSITRFTEADLEFQKKQSELIGDPSLRESFKRQIPEAEKIQTREASKKIKRWSEETAVTNPTFVEKVEQGAGSMLGFLSTNLITGGSTLAPVLLESLTEAASVYETNRDKGMDIGEASKLADMDLVGNLIVNKLLNVFDLAGVDTGKIKKAITGATTEGLQEGLQQLMSNATTDRPLMEGVFESMGVGSVTGGVTTLILPSGGTVDINISEESLGKEEGVVPEEEKVDQSVIQPFVEQAKKFQSAEDFAEIQGTSADKQMGVISSTRIVARDTVDKTTQEYADLKTDIEKNGIEELVIVQVKEDGTIETTEGSHRVEIAIELGIDVPVIVVKGNVEGLQTIKEIYDTEVKVEKKPAKKAIKRTSVEVDGKKVFKKEVVELPAKEVEKIEKRKARKFAREKSGVSISATAGGNEIVRLSPAKDIQKKDLATDELFVQLNKSAKRTKSDIVLARGLDEKTMAFYEGLVKKGLLTDFKKSETRTGTLAFKAKLTEKSKLITESKLEKLFRETSKKLDAKTSVKVDAKKSVKVTAGKVVPPVKEAKKPKVEPKKPVEKSTIEKKIAAVKDVKSAKVVLKEVRKELESAVIEAEGMAIIAQEQRAGLNTDNVAKLKRIFALNKKFQEGDIETMRASKSKNLVNKVVENVQEIHPEMTEQEAFDFAISLPTKADEKGRTPNIIDLERKEKKLSKLMNQLKEKQEELLIKENEELSEEWLKALSAQEELVSVVKVPESQLPVGEGKLKVSRLEARTRDSLGKFTDEEIEALGISTFNQMNKKENIAKASAYVTLNPDEALRVIRGEIDPPKGLLTNSVYIALHRLGAADTDIATKVSSLGATRMGQEISILSEILKDSPVAMMESVVKTRVEAFEKRTKTKVNDKIKREKKKIDKDLKAPNSRQWDAFLQEVLC